MSVAYLGPNGTFSEDAALKRFGNAITTVACDSIDDVFRNVESDTANYGVVPVENSTEGAVGRTMDLLLQTPLTICGEIQLPVHQFLMAQQTDLSQINKIYSHPQSLAQCHHWLKPTYHTSLILHLSIPLAMPMQPVKLRLTSKQQRWQAKERQNYLGSISARRTSRMIREIPHAFWSSANRL